MDINEFDTSNMKELPLGNGKVQVYDFGDIKLHAYITNDALNDVSYLIETDEEFVGLETPAFYEDLKSFNNYINQLGKPLNHILLAYHTALTDDYKGRIYATENYVKSVNNGGIKALLDNFKNIFGTSFNTNIPKVTDIINEGKITLSGVNFIITKKDDGYTVEIPVCNAVYIHMVGSDVHNILPSIQYIDEFICDMQSYKQKRYSLILTSHYKPETIGVVDVKIEYLSNIKKIFEENKYKDDFIRTVKNKYPNYVGENYLQMTANMLYK